MRSIRLVLTVASLVGTAAASASAGNDPLSPIDAGSVVVTGRSVTPASPNIFGTVALDAGVTPYGARWRRVSAADGSDPRVLALGAATAAAASDPLGRLAFVQQAVAQRVRWSRDLDTYRISDYWAQAGETLTRGAGDGEDIAVLKMQVLKAAGFAVRDIYLSVGRDPQRGEDTKLLVRVGSQFYQLDDRDAQPRLAQGARQFVPIYTLGKDSAWIHGSRFAGRSSNRPVARTFAARSLAARTMTARPARALLVR
jgi:predicted transglutaminase-like cysteine proteinase